MHTRPEITMIAALGDSLTDRGTLNDKYLGFIPMRLVSGLQGKSPQGSFTNGFAWSDHLAVILMNEFIINKLKRENQFDDMDIVDAIIRQDDCIKEIKSYYNLQNDKAVKYKGEEFFLSFSEGGLTSYDYSWWPSKSVSRFFTRLILSTLEKKRNELLQHATTMQSSMEQRAKTLIIEWSGANDLITVNEKPSLDEVDRIVMERMKNIEELAANGYYNFVLCNLPDLSLTPRFQAKSAADQANAKACVNALNMKLKQACENIQARHPNYSIVVFDVFSEFEQIYNNPTKYGFDIEKLKTPYLKSNDFKMNKDGTSPAKGFMYWDDVHPSGDMHALLAYKFYLQLKDTFHFLPPNTYQHNQAFQRGPQFFKLNDVKSQQMAEPPLLQDNRANRACK